MKITKTIITYCHDSSLTEGQIKVFKPYTGTGDEKVETRKESKYVNYTLSLNPTGVILDNTNTAQEIVIKDLFLELRNIDTICAGIEMHFVEDSEDFIELPEEGVYNVLVKYPSELPQNCTGRLNSFPFIVHKENNPFPKLEKFWPLKDWIVSDLNI